MIDDVIQSLQSREYRSEFLRENVTSWIVYQVRALREQRGWTQAQLGQEMGGKTQGRVAQIESHDYGKWNVGTLLDVAAAFDIALEVRFVSWPEHLQRMEDTSPAAMMVPAFDEAGRLGARIQLEPIDGETWVARRDDDVTFSLRWTTEERLGEWAPARSETGTSPGADLLVHTHRVLRQTTFGVEK